MEWGGKYVFLRVGPDRAVELVHSCDSIRDANYWLEYIAEPGDAMCMSPLHPKHEGEGLKYNAHRAEGRDVGRDEGKWREQVQIGDASINDLLAKAQG